MDRSRYERRVSHCARAGFLRYDWGGHGLAPKSTTVALSTGTLAHEALAQLLSVEAYPPRELARTYIEPLVADYKTRCLKGGFSDAPDSTMYVVNEQGCLAEGLFWAAYRRLLPWLAAEFQIVAVEQEEWLVVGCTCGAGEDAPLQAQGSTVTHGGRTCLGTAILTRPDFVARNRTTGAITVFDFKTSSSGLDGAQLEHSLQLYLSMKAVERRLQEPVLDYYLIGLLKGTRRADYNYETKKYDGPRRQGSPLCYAYHRPAVPPMSMAEWSAEKKIGKGWAKIPIWEGYFQDKPSEMSNIEHWVLDQMSDEESGNVIEILGPCQRPDLMMSGVLEQIRGNAEEWDAKCAAIKDNPDLIDTYIPQSWECSRFYGGECEFKKICGKYPGTEDPLQSGLYEIRRPHHMLELESFAARGVISPDVEVPE